MVKVHLEPRCSLISCFPTFPSNGQSLFLSHRTGNEAGFQHSLPSQQPQATALPAPAQTQVTLHTYLSQEAKTSEKDTLPPTYMLIQKDIKHLYTNI